MRTLERRRAADQEYDMEIPITVEFSAPFVLEFALRNGAECSSLEPLGLWFRVLAPLVPAEWKL